jgi:uncharacterized protein YceK
MKAIALRTIVFLIMIMVLTSGCASITRGTTEAYAVQTKPPGAEVRSSSGWNCVTPCSVKVKRRGDFVLTMTKPGYEDVTATVTSSIDGAGAAGMAGNVILGGIIGAGIDAGTGAMHSHKPNPLVVEMVAIGASAQTAAVTSSLTAGAAGRLNAPPSVQLRAVDETSKSGCDLITPITKGAGGVGDPSGHLEVAMQEALNEAASRGADSYYVVNASTTASGASVILEALSCP